MINKSEENSESFPIDLIHEILSRLPAKSVGRFCSVSKLWSSMLHRPYFTELSMTRTFSRPRLLFALEQSEAWSFFSLAQPQNPVYEKSSSLVVPADLHFKLPRDHTSIYPSSRRLFACGYASGLIYFSDLSFSEDVFVPVICNPITGQYRILPKHTSYRKSYSFLGFDPIDKQYKVLSMGYPRNDDDDSVVGHRILTIGTGEMMWRKIHCSLTPEPLSEGICINGVLYYLAHIYVEYLIVCFDVRSEEFKFIDAKCFRDLSISKLINYKGTLGGISLGPLGYTNVEGRQTFNINMCVLEDSEKHEWLKHVYTLPKNKIFDDSHVFVVGMTSTGEIVLSAYYRYDEEPFYVFYFNIERKAFQTVEIQGFGASEKFGTVYAFVDHAEYLSAKDAKLLKSNMSAQSVNNNCEPDNPSSEQAI